MSRVQGKIIAAVSYVAPVSEVRSSEGSQVSISRIYSTDKGSALSFKRSDTIKITITPNFSETAPDGYYEVTDILPAGFRFVRSTKWDEKSICYPDEVTGQKVVFGYYYNKARTVKENIVYYARAVNPGTFTADNPVIRHIESNAAGFTEKAQITVSD